MTETDLSLYAVGTLTDEEAREAVAWRYDGEYAVYNFPSWDECAARGWSITDAVKRKNACGMQENFSAFFISWTATAAWSSASA